MRQRLRRLPAFVLMVVGFALFVGGGILVTLPYDAPALDDPALTLECGPPPFELVDHSSDDRPAISEACSTSASSRFWFGLLGMAVGLGAGLAGRRIHRRQVMAALAGDRDGPGTGLLGTDQVGAPTR